MKSIASRLPLILAGAVLSVATVMLTMGRLEYCGQPVVSQPHINAAAIAGTPGPTLAPPLKVVFVQVEADKLDLEISWAEN